MAIDQSELASFHKFIGERLENGGPAMTATEALDAFQAYKREVEQLRKHLEKSDSDEGRTLDDDALKERVRNRLAERGITE